VASRFISKINQSKHGQTKTKIFSGKKIEIFVIPSLISPHPNKKTLDKSSNRKKNTNKNGKKTGSSNLILYISVIYANIKEILKLKNNFLNLLAKKIKKIYKMVKDQNKPRLRINMTTKKLLYCQIIVPMCTENVTKIVAKSSRHMININYLLKNIIIITNSITTQSDLNLIEKYIKDINTIQANIILTLHLSQSKSYLKILDILYINKTTSTSINLEIVENIIWSIYIFNNICLISKPHIIKVSSKSDMAIV